MATTHPHRWFDLTTHRPWEDWASFILGLIVLLAPAALEMALSTAAITTVSILALAVMVLAMLETVSWKRWEELLEAVCGVALLASPWFFGYGGAAANLHMVAGALVVVLGLLEFWQDRNRTE